MELYKKLASWFLRLAFRLNLRIFWTLLVRSIRMERERMPLKRFAAPGELEKYLAMKFKYRPDPGFEDLIPEELLKTSGWIDYVSHPEYFQFQLEAPGPDGDCDDIHWYAANVLKLIPEVEQVYFLCSGFVGGGHATAVYKYAGHWYHFDYHIFPLDDPNDAPLRVAKRYTKKGMPIDVTYWSWESVGEHGTDHSHWKMLAISPDKLPVH